MHMDDEKDAEYAIRALDRSEFGRKGRRLRVEWTKVIYSFFIRTYFFGSCYFTSISHMVNLPFSMNKDKLEENQSAQEDLPIRGLLRPYLLLIFLIMQK